MVTITGYKTQLNSQGVKNIFLKVEGGMMTVVSKTSGKAYFKSLKANVFAAVDEEVAKSLIGFQLPGTIKQLEVEPYELINEDTGEIRVLDYKSEYFTPEQFESLGV